MKRIVYLILSALVFAACTPSEPTTPSMIVEGWIDADGYPVVMLHQSYVLDDIPDTLPAQSIEQIAAQQIIMWGKVVISDGEQEIILTGRLDTAYLPPYLYNTINMRGEVGKTYTIDATYKNFHATARTTIPPRATIDSLRIQTQPSGEVAVRAFMSNVPQEKAYYATFLRYKGLKQFLLCPFGVFDNSKAKDGRMEIPIYTPLADTTRYIPSLNTTDTIYQLKIARMDEESYRFWSAYSTRYMSGGFFFVSIFENLPSNVENGLGIFSGFGSSIYDFTIYKDTTFVFEK